MGIASSLLCYRESSLCHLSINNPQRDKQIAMTEFKHLYTSMFNTYRHTRDKTLIRWGNEPPLLSNLWFKNSPKFPKKKGTINRYIIFVLYFLRSKLILSSNERKW